MFKEEFENLERHTRELEAVKNYAQTKEERDSLAVEAAQLRDSLTLLKAELEREAAKSAELSSRLDNSEATVKELSLNLDEAKKELASLREFRAKLPEGPVPSLEEMKSQFLGAEEGEIERRAKARLEELEKRLDSEMPALIHQRLIEVVNRPELPPEIAGVINPRAAEMADQRLRDRAKWPGWFRDYYLNEVEHRVGSRLDVEFEKRVQARAEERLDALKAGPWKEYAANKARELSSDLKSLVNQLQGTWSFTCDRCGRSLPLAIGPSEIGVLLQGEAIDVTCAACLDPAPFPLFLTRVAHKVGSLNFAGLLQTYMGEPPVG